MKDLRHPAKPLYRSERNFDENLVSEENSEEEDYNRFRSKIYCSSAIKEVTEDVREKIDSRTNGHVCFKDFKEATNPLDHQILIRKLEQYGYRGLILDIMISYLSDRRQYVITKCTSPNKTLEKSRCFSKLSATLLPVLNVYK